jgi:hypothetical protein
MLINRAHIRTLALDVAAKHRPAQKFTRVADEFYTRLDAHVRDWVRKEIESQPSKGQTIR